MSKVYEMKTTVDALKVHEEDGGCALIFEGDESGETLGDGCFFVRLQSWDDNGTHPLMNSLKGKKIKVTVEIE